MSEDCPAAASTMAIDPKNRRRLVRAVLWGLGALLAWYLLLNFTRYPVVPQLDLSWIAALTFAAANKMQFGRDIVFTYGPLSHVLYGTYTPTFFTLDRLLEIFLKTTFVVSLCILSARLDVLRRGCFLLVAFVAAMLSTQALYLFVLVCLGLCVTRRSRPDVLLILPLLLFATIAALIKLTFLWASLATLGCGLFCALVRRDFYWAAIVPLVFLVIFCSVWYAVGQQLSGLADFLAAGFQIMAGYPAAMSIPPTTVCLTAGLLVATASTVQLATFLSRNFRAVAGWSVSLILVAALFLSWKLSFTRAVAHSTHSVEFFYYAAIAMAGAPMFFPARLQGRRARVELLLLVLTMLVSSIAVLSQFPQLPERFARTIASRWLSNVAALMYPGTEQRKDQQRNLSTAKRFNLPGIKNAIGNATVDVFGYEQAIALCNGLNYTPSPTVQNYCDYTARLAQLNSAFYASARRPEYVIFKLQTIDNRLPTIDCAEVLMMLAHDYESLFSEKGYLLLRQSKLNAGWNSKQLKRLGATDSQIGKTITIPSGWIWCKIHIHSTLTGKLLSFFYQAPPLLMRLQMADKRVLNRRILPALAGNGFLLNPMPFSNQDFQGLMAGHPGETTRMLGINIVDSSSVRRFFKRKLEYEFFEIPPFAPPTPP
jgi:hypothetical protein